MATTDPQSDFLFCEMCGTMLCFKSRKYAECSLCKSKKPAKDVVGKKICHIVSEEGIRFIILRILAEKGTYLFRGTNKSKVHFFSWDGQIRRELGISTLVVAAQKIRSTDHNVRCPKCGKLHVHYHTRQTRSADEGETLFYDCPSCGHSFTENS